MVDLIRVSEGTGAVLGLWNRKLSAYPTTAYLMTYHEGKCTANCGFCPQARSSVSSPEKLSRVSWPKWKFDDVLEALSGFEGPLSRVCVQTLNYPEMKRDLFEIVTEIRKISDFPISVCSQPLNENDIIRLGEIGVDRLGIPLDAANSDIFGSVKGNSVKGPYDWESHIESLERACEFFDGGISTHLIVGLGEEEIDMINQIQFLDNKGIRVGLFAFTPIEGTDLADGSRPAIEKYRRIQLAHYLIVNDISNVDDMEFENGNIVDFGISFPELKKIIKSGEAFQTSGCLGCNRPFYNESPRGPIYNFPEKLSEKDLKRVFSQLGFSNESE